MDSFYPSPVLTDVLDSDADGVSDTLEALLQLNAQDSSDASKDEDEDRLNLAEETFLGTSDLAVDTDGDEVTDWDEVFIYQTDPSIFDDYTSLELSGITASAAVTSSSNLLNNGSFSFNFTAAKKTYSAVSATAPTGRRAKRIWNRLSNQNFEGDIIWETGLDTSVGGWQAIGTEIEFWEGQGVEIDENSGVKQTVELEPGTYLLVWDHRARNDTRASDSEYSALAKLYEGANLSEKSYAAPGFEEEKANEEETDEQLKKNYDFMRGAVKTAAMTFEVPEIAPGDTTKQEVELSFQAPEDSGGMGAIINNVNLLPVEVKVNDTDKEEDDLVPVSKGVDEDLATDFSVKLSGISGVTAELKVKGSDGAIKFKDEILTLTDGTEVQTKLWGISPSSAEGKTIIEITLRKDGEELEKIEEEVTVFKGVKLEFEGNYYINVDTRDWGRRPWDNRAEVKTTARNLARIKFYADKEISSKTTAELISYKTAVDQSASFGYQSAISFKDGDNSEIPIYKPWKDKLEVKISKVMAKTPSFEIQEDEILNSILEFKKGVMDGADVSEEIVDPQIKVGDFLTLHETSVKTKIDNASFGSPTIGEAQINAQINAEKGKGYDELLNYYSFTSPSLPTNESRPKDLAFASGFLFDWMNDSFDVKKESKIKDSFAAKAIRGEKENGNKVEVKWTFTEWNEFKSQGLLKDAIIETK